MFCTTLANHGIKLSLKIGDHFSFSLVTKVKAPAPVVRKQLSPSAMRRNDRSRTDTPMVKATKDVVNVAEVIEDDTSPSPPLHLTTPATPSPRKKLRNDKFIT